MKMKRGQWAPFQYIFMQCPWFAVQFKLLDCQPCVLVGGLLIFVRLIRSEFVYSMTINHVETFL